MKNKKKNILIYFLGRTILYSTLLLIVIVQVLLFITSIVDFSKAEIEETTGYAIVENCYKGLKSDLDRTNIDTNNQIYNYITVLRYQNQIIKISDMNTYSYCYNKINERVLCKINISRYKFPFEKDPEYNVVSVIR